MVPQNILLLIVLINLFFIRETFKGLYIFSGILIVIFSVLFFVIKHFRKKIARQYKLIEQQKLDKILNSYALHGIDMLMEVQQIERQHAANNMHDALGSMLAALKLNFENLRLRQKDANAEENRLYDRTETLIEEAYKKVKGISNIRDFGAVASKCLIPALKMLAEKLSLPGRTTLCVTAFGFNKKLENKIEIVIFRIIYELAVNSIKHSGATEASVQLTHHDDNINIIVEDNGIGFNKVKQFKTGGTGLQTIIKKTEELGGTFTIDSTPNIGTTIIIDIPV